MAKSKTISLQSEVSAIIEENDRRNAEINTKFNPVTGENSVGERIEVAVDGCPLKKTFLPKEMMRVPLIKHILKCKSVDKYLEDIGAEVSPEERHKVIDQIVRVRFIFDFPFWAAILAFIKSKGGGDDILFRLNRPQRRLVAKLEKMRKAGKPIRLVLLKARQWGGSTCIQIYMAWLQLVHKKGLNSLVVGHVLSSSTEVKDMFEKLMERYPIEYLYALGEEYNEKAPKYVGVGTGGNIHRIPQRNCKIKIGSAERPNSARGGDYNLVHLTEVGLYQKTDKKTPEDIVRSATSGVLYKPYTMIVYESTANGTGNFFHREYLSAKKGKSQFEHMFVSWYEIEQYSTPFANRLALERFAAWLYENRKREDVTSDREESGAYLWWLWKSGATLEAINWYISERSKYTCHDDMASEFPSNDIEAFAFSGNKVFSEYDIEKLRPSCKPPRWVGEIYGSEDEGEEALDNLRFVKEPNGRLNMWQDVEVFEDEAVDDRYLVIVDVCKGHTKNADYADILVIDRLYMASGEPPAVVAEWHGHIDMDKLAWKAVQVAAYYNNALLVIESNTLETNNTKGEAEYILTLIHEVYEDGLYARKQSAEDIKAGKPQKYGYHTNVLTKKVVIHNLKRIIREQLYTEREEACLDEYSTYVENDGVFEAQEGHHDDRLMTRAIGMQVCYHEMPLPTIRPIRHTKTRRRKRAVSAASI